ncbi:MAG: ATP-binding protein [Muribaculaceae bacterium]|nr:ATP-binding protein [Muribaculaceae bacterium]
MAKLHIEHVGPVVKADFEMRRFNFFIGRQGSGKSTIAKIVSYCTWLEKEVQTHPDRQGDLSKYEQMFRPQLERFHSMHGYLREDSLIAYESDYTVICYKGGRCEISLKPKSTYERVKVLYVPAERVLAISDIIQTNDNNVKSFSVDFDSARQHYGYQNRLGLAHLGIKYYQTMENGEPQNRIVADGKEYDIRLDDSSSGLQSIVPVAVAIDFYSKVFYSGSVEAKTLSVAQERDRKTVRNHLASNGMNRAVELRIERLLQTHRTSFVVEEPELNLYPTTQRDLLNFIVACCNGRRKHVLTVTTHSPYIINQLNVLLRANYTPTGRKTYPSINPEDLAAFKVSNGGLMDLMATDEDTNQLVVNTLDLSEAMEDIYNDYASLSEEELVDE